MSTQPVIPPDPVPEAYPVPHEPIPPIPPPSEMPEQVFPPAEVKEPERAKGPMHALKDGRYRVDESALAKGDASTLYYYS